MANTLSDAVRAAITDRQRPDVEDVRDPFFGPPGRARPQLLEVLQVGSGNPVG